MTVCPSCGYPSLFNDEWAVLYFWCPQFPADPIDERDELGEAGA